MTEFVLGQPVIYRGKTYSFPGHVCGITDDGQIIVRAIGTPEGHYAGMKHIFGPGQLEHWNQPTLSEWSGWDKSNDPWSASKHQDAVCAAVFGSTWAMDDAAALIGFIDKTWRTPITSKDADHG